MQGFFYPWNILSWFIICNIFSLYHTIVILVLRLHNSLEWFLSGGSNSLSCRTVVFWLENWCCWSCDVLPSTKHVECKFVLDWCRSIDWRIHCWDYWLPLGDDHNWNRGYFVCSPLSLPEESPSTRGENCKSQTHLKSISVVQLYIQLTETWKPCKARSMDACIKPL